MTTIVLCCKWMAQKSTATSISVDDYILKVVNQGAQHFVNQVILNGLINCYAIVVLSFRSSNGDERPM